MKVLEQIVYLARLHGFGKQRPRSGRVPCSPSSVSASG